MKTFIYFINSYVVIRYCHVRIRLRWSKLLLLLLSYFNSTIKMILSDIDGQFTIDICLYNILYDILQNILFV